MDKTVVLLHGWGTVGEGTERVDALRHHLSDVATVVAPTLPLHDPLQVISVLAPMFETIDNPFVVGFSAGAIWAEVSRVIELVPAMLVNPCYDVSMLAKFIGTNQNYVTNEPYEFTEEAYRGYTKTVGKLIEMARTDPALEMVRMRVITCSNDQVVPANEVISTYVKVWGAHVEIIDGPDHQFKDYELLSQIIKNELKINYEQTGQEG